MEYEELVEKLNAKAKALKEEAEYLECAANAIVSEFC
jgi:hypothetical protein